MEMYVYGILFFAGGGALAAGVTVWLKDRASRGYRDMMEREVRSRDQQASRYREEVARLQRESAGLQEDLAQARRGGEEKFHLIRHQLQKKAAGFVLASAVAGLFAGGLFSGILVEAKTRLHLTERMVDLEVTARASEARADFLERQYEDLKKEYALLNRNLFIARETEAVTLTKLQVLLDHLMESKLKGNLILDIEAMRQSLRRQGGGGDINTRDVIPPLRPAAA